MIKKQSGHLANIDISFIGFFSQKQTLEWQSSAAQALVLHLLSLNKHFGESGGKKHDIG